MLNSNKEYDEIAPILSAATHHYPPVDMEASTTLLLAPSPAEPLPLNAPSGAASYDAAYAYATNAAAAYGAPSSASIATTEKATTATVAAAPSAQNIAPLPQDVALPPPVGPPSHAAPSSEPLIPPSTAPAPAAVAVAWAPGTEEPMPVVLGADGRPPRSGRKSSGKSGKEPGSERNKEGGDNTKEPRKASARALGEGKAEKRPTGTGKPPKPKRKSELNNNRESTTAQAPQAAGPPDGR